MKRRLPILFAALLFGLVACGGDGGPPGEVQTEFTVELSDFAFEPSQVMVPPGEEVSVTVENVGSVEHNWVVLQRGVQIEAEEDIPDDRVDFDYATTGLVEPGDSSTLTFTAPSESGVYQLICDVPGHFTAGMEGRFGVAEG